MTNRRWLLVVEQLVPQEEGGPCYRLWLRSIDEGGENVLVPLGSVAELYDALLSEVEESGITSDWSSGAGTQGEPE